MYAVDDKHIETLRAEVPQMPVALFRSAVSGYLEQQGPTPAAIRDELDQIPDLASQLSEKLDHCSDGARQYLEQHASLRWQPDLIRRLIADLDSLAATAELARREAGEGVGPGRTSDNAKATIYLVHSLANILHGHGIEPNAKPTGPLVRSLVVAASAVGKPISDPSGVVRNALKSWSHE